MPHIQTNELKDLIQEALATRQAINFGGRAPTFEPIPSAVLSTFRDLLDSRSPTTLAADKWHDPAAFTFDFVKTSTNLQLGGPPRFQVTAESLRECIRNLMTSTPQDGAGLSEQRVLYLLNLGIEGDLDLSGLVIEGSVKLVCCWVKGAIRLVHTKLQSCEFSGSVCHGLEASYIRVQGSLRARRTVFLGPVDIGASHVGGVIDLMDAVFIPKEMPGLTGVRVPQRGILNLALANVAHDIRLIRAQIFGLVMMDGARIGGCIFMEDLFLASIADTAEIVKTTQSNPRSTRWMKHVELADKAAKSAVTVKSQQDKRLPDAWVKEWQNTITELRANRTAAIMRFLIEIPKNLQKPTSYLSLLHLNKSRAREEAWSGSALIVGGTIKGRNLTILGSVTLDHSRIDGGIELEQLTVATESASKKRTTILSLQHVDANRGNIKLKGRAPLEKGATQPSLNDFEGRIVLSESIVGGSVSICGFSFIAPQTNTNSPDRPLTIEMPYLQVSGSVSILDTSGMCGIKSQGVKIAGSFKLAAKTPTFDREKDRYSEFRKLHNNISGTISLPDAQIGRDLVLVFDRNDGPTLDLTGANVAGRLAILPSNAPDAEAINKEAETLEAYPTPIWFKWPFWALSRIIGYCFNKQRLGRLYRPTFRSRQKAEYDCEHFTQALLRLLKVEERVIRDEVLQRMRLGTITVENEPASSLINRWFASDNKDTNSSPPPVSPNPRIQLRNAVAGMLIHPPTAWPRFGEMRLDGFQYSLVDSIGPLAPIRRRLQNHAIATNNSFKGTLAIIFIVSIVTIYILFSPFGLDGSEPESSPLFFYYSYFGTTVTTTFALSVILALTLFVARKLYPGTKIGQPLSIPWLKLQGGRPSVYKHLGWYGSLGSYLQAARVLRAAGRRNSAAETEYERLRLRGKMLSWRNHLPVKVLSIVVYWISGYGFRPGRAFMCFVLLLCAGGATANQINACGGVLSLQADVGAPSPILMLGDAIQGPKKANQKENKLPLNEGQFSGFAYAIDRYIPGYDGGEVNRWSVGSKWVNLESERFCLHDAITGPNSGFGKRPPKYAREIEEQLGQLNEDDRQETIQKRNQFLSMLNRRLNDLGVILVAFLTLVAISVSARVESLLTRPDES